VDGAALGSENVGDTLRDTEGAAATAERALAARSPEFREELARQRTGLSELCAALPEDSALLSFVRYREETAAAGARGRERYAAFVLRAGAAAPRLFALGAATDLDDAVEAWQERVATDPRLQRATDPVATYRLVAGRLADRLWRPFAYELRGAVQVFVTRDGSIQSVSFATLPTVDGDYLVSSGPTVSYLGAERDLVAPAIGDTRADGLLAIGDPAFGGPVPGARECDPTERFDPLPGAKDEVMEIASRWPATERTVVLTGAAADASTVRRLAPSYGVLHLATHAFQRVGSCGDGETNPLRRSGLALAGANRGARASEPSGRGDGVLTAEDVALLDLHKVEWAVLSACASGRGSIEAGEGILGLERAFRIAGVRNVIASLWAVEDDATRSWMRELYAARRDGPRCRSRPTRLSLRACATAA